MLEVSPSPTTTTQSMLQSASQALALTRPKGIPLLVQSRVDVALAAAADGVHLLPGDLPCAAARQMLGPDAAVGVSVDSVQQTQEAMEAGANYVALDGAGL